MTQVIGGTIIAGLLAGVLTGTSAAAAPDLTIASVKGPPVRVVTMSRDPAVRRTVQWCCDWLRKRGYAVDDGRGPSSGPMSQPTWVLETLDDVVFAEDLGISTSFLKKARGDAFALTVMSPAQHAFVSVVGRDAAGVRAGVARLLALTSYAVDDIRAPTISEQHTPFFPIRRIMIAPTGRIAQDADSHKTWADTLWTNWPDERIRAYAEDLWLMGLNSVELCEIRGYRGVFSNDDLKNHITPKLRVFMKAVRDNGMQVSQFIWGQSLFVEGQNLCWNAPDERAKMEAEYRRLAQTYGDLVDHIVVHVGDPGGCSRNGCDPYKTTQQIATCLLTEYRKVNPKATCTLSTWANEGFWKGAEGAKFLDETWSPAEIGIALHRWYDTDKAKRVRDAGRECDIWGWYLSDYELALDMALLMRRLDAYYTALPAQASTDIRALSTEICFQGWPQIINACVTAQKMWDPKRSLDAIEREFCAGVFGDANADAMVKVYRACEAYVHPERYYAFIPRTDCLPIVFGTPDYNQQVRVALAAGKNVVLDSKRPPRLSSASDPKALRDYLVNNLSLIQVFSEAHEKLGRTTDPAERLKVAGKAEADARPFSNDPDYGTLLSAMKRAVKVGGEGQ